MLSHVQASYNNNLLTKALVTLSLFWRRKMRIFQNQTLDDEEEMPLPLIEKPFTTEDNIISWLRLVSPGFIVDPNKVSVLYEPQEFYSKLLSLSQSAQSQISLASLYLGSGTLEQDLVNTLCDNLSRSKGLLLTVLLDYNRGSRGPVSSRQILHPLVQKFPEQCHVALYHTPLLREPLRSWLPGRANELVGLQHMKLYAFDDTIIISGSAERQRVDVGVPAAADGAAGPAPRQPRDGAPA
ncbi:CDP-diacylglycerol--glycerol-3-phosphate 3-phosphatidyltransferase, partial [Gryllus bimaculatus]